MKILSTFLIVLSMSLTEAYGAPTCSKSSGQDKTTKKVDLIKSMPPVRDQDGIGWCYGFTTADLLTHYLSKTYARGVQGGNAGSLNYLTKSNNVSAMGISSMYNQIKNDDYEKSLNDRSVTDLKRNKIKVVPEGGSIIGSLLAAKSSGFCFEKDVSSEDYSYVADQRCALKNQCKITDMLNIIYESPEYNDCCGQTDIIQKVFPKQPLNTIKDILSNSEKHTALDNLVNASCQKKFINKLAEDQPKVDTKTIKMGQSPTELFKFLDNYLDRGIPVGITYYADFLTGSPVNKSAHTSSIVGKSFNTSTCEVEYILRNSWGRGCGVYLKENPKYTSCANALKSEKNTNTYFTKIKACKKRFNPTYRNPRIRCDEPSGHVYVRKSDLAKHIYNTTAIQEDKPI